ncbi:MAG: DUF5667 domain-containing protein [Candidatus Levyibacteriota bacterium]
MKNVFIFLALSIVVLFSTGTALGKETLEEVIDISSKSATIKYDLAYPGILPNNPLYKLKVLRDKITALLISDPLKRAEFYLLQTDKGILATAMLVDKGEAKLAGETALKTEHNMTLLTYELKRITKKPNSDFINKLKTASLKHQEVLSSLIERVAPDEQKTFTTVVNFSKTNLETIEKFEKKKFLAN